MFTGIVEELGRVVEVTDTRIVVRGPLVTSDATYGASIAVNGCCLTATDLDGDTFAADVMVETFRRTSLGALRAGDPVNLERPVRADGRLGGHVVQGHVDGTGTIRAREADGVVRIGIPAELARYVVAKGSVAVDGVSLTVVEAGDDELTVSLIPATLELTTLGHKGPGDPVNIEVDVLAKYVERLLSKGATT
ncbi:MAG TPA: riboflavin synthase [Mycobacteriales bacterium]|jgi:riboflavin synthase|nr:riboflavin synthase [Mycobacteriales bacterium]